MLRQNVILFCIYFIAQVIGGIIAAIFGKVNFFKFICGVYVLNSSSSYLFHKKVWPRKAYLIYLDKIETAEVDICLFATCPDSQATTGTATGSTLD